MFPAYSTKERQQQSYNQSANDVVDEVEQPKPLDRDPSLARYRDPVNNSSSAQRNTTNTPLRAEHSNFNASVPPPFRNPHAQAGYSSFPQVNQPVYGRPNFGPGYHASNQSNRRNQDEKSERYLDSGNGQTRYRRESEPQAQPIQIKAVEGAYSSHSTELIMKKRQREAERRKAERKAAQMRECVAVRQLRDSSDDDDDDYAVTATVSGLAELEKFRKKNKKDLKKKMQKNKNSKKSKKRRRDSSDSDTSSSDSDSDSSSDSDGSSRRKRKKERKSKKSKKRRRDSRSPPRSSKPTAKPVKYSFLRMDKNEHNTHEGLLYDTSQDSHNIHYEKLQPTITSSYYPLTHSIIGAPPKWSNLFYPVVVAKEERKPKRFHEVVPNEKDTERAFRTDLVKISDMQHVDFIEVSKSKLDVFRFRYEIMDDKVDEYQSEDNRLRMDAEDREKYGIIRPDEVRNIENRLTRIKYAINDKSGDDQLYIEFVDLEMQLFEKNAELGIRAHTNQSLLDRCLSIVQSGLQRFPASYALRLKKIEILKKKGGTDELLQEWDTLLNRFLNKTEVWNQYLNFIQYDSSIYTFQRMEKAFAQCRTKLGNLINDTIKSHKKEPDTEEFYKDMYIRSLEFLFESGYSERAIASIQASCELHLFKPPRLANASPNVVMAAFKEFWNSGHPRIGDYKCFGGWAKYDEMRQANSNFDVRREEKYELELYRTRAQSLYNKVAASNESYILSWVELEREFSFLNVRPLRGEEGTDETGESPDDTFKKVVFDDLFISETFFPLDVLAYFGITFIEFIPTDESTVSVLRKMDSCSLTSIYNSKPFLKTMKSIILALARSSNEAQIMMSYIPTSIRLMKLKHAGLSEKKIVKKFIDKVLKLTIKLGIMQEEVKELVFYFAAFEAMKVGVGEKPQQFMEMLIKTLLQHARNGFEKLDSLRASVLFCAMLTYLEMNSELTIEQYIQQMTKWMCFLEEDQPISPKHYLQTFALLNQLENFAFPVSEEFENYISLIEHAKTAICSLQVYMAYCRSPKNGDGWLSECRKIIIGEEEFYPTRRALLNVLEYHWKTHHSHRSEFLEECKAFIRVLNTYPEGYLKLVKLFTSLRYYKILPFFDELESVSEGISKKYAALSKMLLLTRDSDFSTESLRGQRNLLEVATGLNDTSFWRLLLTRYTGENVFLRSLEHCAWSKYLIIDRIELKNNNSTLEELQLLMTEKDTRVIVDIEEVETLLENAVPSQDEE